MAELVGQKLGEFDLRVYLGEGAHVHAYLAFQPSQNREVVIKVLKSTLANTAEFVERFQREAQAALALRHPNIVTVYDYAREDDTLYIVEEFLPGGSLMDIFRNTPGPLPLEKTIRSISDIAAALDFAHERGIVHGDLKPENVLYKADGAAALSDLGITKDLDQKAARTRDGLAFGNPGYMSPEEWRGEPADVRTDIYALGILLFEMLTGQLPFDNVFTGSFAFVHLMHLVSKPIALASLRPDLSLAVEAVIIKAMEKERENRFATAGALVKAFRAALESKEAPPKPAPTATPVAKPFWPSTASITAEPAPPPSTPQPQPTGQPTPRPQSVLRIERITWVLVIAAFIAGFVLARLLN